MQDMTNQEFSNGFDTLVASYRRFKDFDNREILDSVEFDEYEKSFYLTKAQEELVISLYNGKNPYGDSFESTEEMRRYLAPLVEETSLTPIQSASGTIGMGSASKFFTLPDNLLFITYEDVAVSDGKCGEGSRLDVYPVTQDEYHKVKRNPFRGANDRRALRLDLSDGVVEVVSKYSVTDYYVRYLRKPNPIILEDLPNELEINGVSTSSACELHESLHRRILERAVAEAMQSKAAGGGKENNNRK